MNLKFPKIPIKEDSDMAMRSSVKVANYYQDENLGFSPERSLLMAMLYRALKDLESNGPYRALAISWLESDYETSTRHKFTFEDCVDYLDLDSTQLKFIKIKIQEAKGHYGKFFTKREKSGEGSKPLPKRTHFVRYSEKNEAVLRNGGYFGHHLRRVS